MSFLWAHAKRVAEKSTEWSWMFVNVRLKKKIVLNFEKSRSHFTFFLTNNKWLCIEYTVRMQASGKVHTRVSPLWGKQEDLESCWESNTQNIRYQSALDTQFRHLCCQRCYIRCACVRTWRGGNRKTFPFSGYISTCVPILWNFFWDSCLL